MLLLMQKKDQQQCVNIQLRKFNLFESLYPNHTSGGIASGYMHWGKHWCPSTTINYCIPTVTASP